MKKFSLILCIFLLSACAKLENQETVQMGVDGIIVNLDNKVIRGDQVVTIHPTINLQAPPTALFVPFGLRQESGSADAISDGLSRIIYQQFLAEKPFSALEYSEGAPLYRTTYALSRARNSGAQFLVTGYITYYFAGGATSDTRISYVVEIYDVASGDLLWNIQHSGYMPYEKNRDFFAVQVKNRRPFDPTYAVMSTLAKDTAKLLRMWTDPNYETEADIEEAKSEQKAF